ncbi:MAG: FtsW/RodA/SpoVE family cell cycle protein [Lachnospiraceae bacterium]|nr:FtsW/RodA/SpoVE family cell cycle protein [Lachnospiraceae bacterium]
MAQIIVSISRYTMIILFAIYVYDAFRVMSPKMSYGKRDVFYTLQAIIVFLILTNGYAVLYLKSEDPRILLLYAMEVVFLILVILVFKYTYQDASKGLINNMCMLFVVGFIILCRLDLSKNSEDSIFNYTVKHLIFAVLGLVLTAFIPLFMKNAAWLKDIPFLYAGVGIILLASVLLVGNTVNGAKLNIGAGIFSFQPSEFVKIIFVFFLASMLSRSDNLMDTLITVAVSMVFFLILVLSRDLGACGIFYIAFIFMLYTAKQQPLIVILGIGLLFPALFMADKIMSHVHKRVLAWQDPLSYAEDQGYQVCQSLFAIGTGGWFGTGLTEGMPYKIPVVAQDFVFAAISEELGAAFAICLILVCLSCIFNVFNIALQIPDKFYKLVAFGLGIVYGFQVFLTIGGVIKFIPSTGVTLPLVSYGGSSLLSTMIIFAIVQGIYVISSSEDEEEYDRRRRYYRNRARR